MSGGSADGGGRERGGWARAARVGVRRRFRHGRVYPRLELALAALALLAGIGLYAALTERRALLEGFGAPAFVVLLIATLVPLIALLMLIARRVAVLLASRRQAGGGLHVRLLALFAVMAAVPTILVAGFAAVLFQFGVQFWFSDRAKTVLDNADRVAQAYVEENKSRILDDIIAMGVDLTGYARDFGLTSKDFRDGLAIQVLRRNLSEAAVFTLEPGGTRIIAQFELDRRPFDARMQALGLANTRVGQPRVVASAGDRVEAVVRLDAAAPLYVYVSRRVEPRVLEQVARTQTALNEYRSMTERGRALQWRFALALILMSLLIVAAAITLALWLANRLVAPIARLADAAERVGAGDLEARVAVPRGARDEIDTLARAFNRMTGQLKAQQSALISANRRAEDRRRFIEAVLSGVSAGVVSVDDGGRIRLANRSAAALLGSGAGDLANASLPELAPELAALVDQARQEGISAGQVTLARGGSTRTLAVRLAADPGAPRSYILTFDDISQQIADQRHAAWSDVARRIAHEIKNPLTPIQLSAERLQRRYGRHVDDQPELFAELTGTIVRQVGDLRRMVDEFSSFARMPRPQFQPEDLAQIARQALFLAEVASPGIRFTLDAPAELPGVVCDRRQIGQALTNLIKNAAESITAAGAGAGVGVGAVTLRLTADEERAVIEVEDDGPGLPPDLLERATEPYVTTRARGTGLGLAIVKRIAEEHGGRLDLRNTADGGAVARMEIATAAAAAPAALAAE